MTVKIFFHFIDISKSLCTIVSVSTFIALEMHYRGGGDMASASHCVRVDCPERNSQRSLSGKLPIGR